MLFKDVLVEKELKLQLINLIKENRVSHAQLFLGPAGSHKFALAVAFAQYLCCENKGDEDSCGICPSCVKFDKLSHPDFHLIFPNCITKKIKKEPDYKQFATQFKDFVFKHNYLIDINDWNETLGGENKQTYINARDCSHIINQNSIRSYEGGYKIYLLWMVERLYHLAAPKLLKTLEEPESKTLFILIAENSENILSTILSRTQLVKIPPLSPEVIQSQLINEYHADEEKARDVASIAEGNYIDAIKYYNDNSELSEALHKFQFFMSSAVGNMQNDIANIRFLELQEMFNDIIAEEREGQKRFLNFMMRMFRHALLINTKNELLVRTTSEEKKCAEQFAPYIRLRNISPIIDECNKAILHIERNGNSSLIFMDLYLTIAKLITERRTLVRK